MPPSGGDRPGHCGLSVALIAFFTSISAFGQSYNISTIAGGASPPNNVPGTSASLYNPQAVAVDKAGNVFFVDQDDVLRLDVTAHVLTLVAGNGTGGFSGDNGPATSAQLFIPSGIAVDSAGNLYIADSVNNRVRKVSNGTITTVAGTGTGGFSGDNGAATSAQLSYPAGVAVDSAGNLYIADQGNLRIRKVTSGVITTIAGTGSAGFSGDNGSAASAQLNQPTGVAVDSAGNLYIADEFNGRIREVSNGVISTVAGGGTSVADNVPAISAQLSLPHGISLDGSSNLYIVDPFGSRVRKVSNGTITTVAVINAAGTAVDSAGNLYISDPGNLLIVRVSGSTTTTVAGGASLNLGDSGPATSATLQSPAGVAVDSAGNVYIADVRSQRIRRVSGGVITTIAGGGTSNPGDSGPPTSAYLRTPRGVAVDSAGNLYIADSGASRVRKVSSGGITTVAGNGTNGFSGDNGAATSAQLSSPTGVALDSQGNLYIADSNNSRIRKVSNGVITTVAGNGTYGFSGDNGLATSAELGVPSAITFDSTGNLYIADAGNSRIRKVSNGVITTVAGGGAFGFGGDNGPATSATLNFPQGVAVDSAGSIYIADADFFSAQLLNASSPQNRIRKVAGGIITTVAGTGVPGFGGDNGPATSAEFNEPAAVAVDSAGNVYVADAYNNRIRLLTPVVPVAASQTITFAPLSNFVTSASINIAPFSISATASSGLAVTFASTTPAVCTVAGNTVSIVALGTCSITASQGGSALWLPATPVTQSFTITASAGTLPVITQGGVGPIDSSSTTVQTGSWVTIYGTNLATTTALWNGNFPTMLGGVTVTIDGRNAYLSYVSPTQINLQVPDDTATGVVNVTITNATGSFTTTVTLGPVGPSFLLLDAKHVTGIILRFDGSGTYGGGTYDIIGPTGTSLGYMTVAAKQGDIVELFGVGFGPTNPPVLAGQIYSGAAPTTNPVQLTVGGTSVTPSFAGVSSAGLYQINLTVPPGLGTGDQSLLATVGGVQTQSTVVISLQ